MYSCFNPNTLLVPLINKCMIGQNVLCFSATATPQTNAKITKLYFWHSDQKVSQTKGAGLMYSAVTQWMCTCSFHTGNYPSSHIKHTLNNTSICKIHLASYKMPIRTRASIQFFLSIWGCCCWVVIQWGQDGPDCGGSERRTDGRLWVYSFKCYGAINVSDQGWEFVSKSLPDGMFSVIGVVTFALVSGVEPKGVTTRSNSS